MKKAPLCTAVLMAVHMVGVVIAGESLTIPWDLQALSSAPNYAEDPQHNTNDVKAIFYDGLLWRGHPTRVFAYYGLPKIAASKKVPAMVLVHGGGGTAFANWVQLWNRRGYAAIAMDTCGCISGGTHNKRPRHAQGGPPGRGDVAQIGEPIQDQWPYHAVADIILAHSLIRSLPQVDSQRVGLTGNSMGGCLTCIAAGVDSRFRFAAPVYGCGFLDESPLGLTEFKKMGPERAAQWLKLWDPSVYLRLAHLPMLWVDGSNDYAFPMDALQKSYRLPDGPRTLCTRLRMPHGQDPGAKPEEIHAFAEALFNNGVPLATIIRQGHTGRQAFATFESQVPVSKAELNYTTDLGIWQKRNWQTIPATLDVQARKISAVLPPDATVYYFNLIDERKLIVSSEHEELPATKVTAGDRP